MTPTGLPVDDILARDVSVQWCEAVALVRAVCRQIVATGAAGFPAPAQVVLYAEGAVVALTTVSQHPVHGAAHLLASLLTEEVPVRLRLMVSQATGAVGAYANLEDFADALAYFERPDPDVLLIELHRRASAAPLRGDVAPAPSPMPGVSLPTPSPHEARSSGRTGRWAAGAAAAAALLCLPVWLLGSRVGGMSDLAGLALGAGPDSAAATAALEKGTEPAGTSTTRAATARRTGPTVSGSQPIASTWGGGPADTDMLPLHSPDTVRLISALDSWALAPTAVPAVAPASRPFPATGDAAVYSRDDAEVVPPQSVYPKLSPDRSGGSAGPRTVLELLISAEGLVERVRLRTPPRDVHEFMLVSAAKAWRFDPATVHGRPVRFLHHVVITPRD